MKSVITHKDDECWRVLNLSNKCWGAGWPAKRNL